MDWRILWALATITMVREEYLIIKYLAVYITELAKLVMFLVLRENKALPITKMKGMKSNWENNRHVSNGETKNQNTRS